MNKDTDHSQQLEDLHKEYVGAKRTEKRSKVGRYVANTVGAAGIVSAAITHNKVSEAAPLLIGGAAGVAVASELKQKQTAAARTAHLTPGRAAHVYDDRFHEHPETDVKSWIAKALPKGQSELLIQRAANNTLREQVQAGYEQADRQMINVEQPDDAGQNIEVRIISHE